jgi:gamma-glutamylputrescine oxidase
MSNRPQDQAFWYINRQPSAPLLNQHLKADIVIVGGGMAGLSAAQAFRSKNKSVILLEQHFCGSGASGKSSGFITPSSEYALYQFVKRYNPPTAKKLWEFVISGVNLIKKNKETYAIACDYQEQDCLVVANSRRGIAEITKEYNARIALGYEATLYTADSLTRVLTSTGYHGALQYPGSFGINPYAYCQAMKKVLIDEGVQIYEDTQVTKIDGSGVETTQGSVQAQHIIVSADRWIPELEKLTHEIYHAQTFLMISEPLSDSILQSLFPQKNMMVWDTDMIYTYYRPTSDNRILLGGGSLFSTYDTHKNYRSTHMFNKLTRYFHKKFPHLPINFEYMWPGLIGISKDIIPIAGFDKDSPSIYYIGAAAGLPWAAALGAYSAEKIVNGRSDFDSYFSPYRSFFIPNSLQNIIGTKASFALSNYKSLYYE